MADDVTRTGGPHGPTRIRPEQLSRPTDGRRQFTTREAQRRLQEKERPRWALVAYAVFLVATVSILSVTYTTYAFSLYRGVILPGVNVDGRSLSGRTESGARKYLENQVAAIDVDPVHLVYRGTIWKPSADEIGYHPNPAATAQAAYNVGRQEDFISQLLDRGPIHPDHTIPLIYHLNDADLRTYIERAIARQISLPATNAGLRVIGGDVSLVPSHPGRIIDMPGTTAAVHAALGSLSTMTEQIRVNDVPAAITDSYARGIRDRVENLLDHTPVISLGKRVIVMKRQDIAQMLSFSDVRSKDRASIVMTVDPNKVQAYITALAASVDRPARNARLNYAAGKVQVAIPVRLGRTLVQSTAYDQLLSTVKALKPNARLRFTLLVTKPPIDLSNPASLGINRNLAIGETSFVGAGDSRLNDITTVASRLNDDLLPPNGDISFNQLVGTGWPTRVYEDQEHKAGGKLVPAAGGAMQQVATTFFRALYAAGLKIVERHNHVYRLGWYEPPVGLDAVVYPANNEDLVFSNNTGKYLLITTRVEPVRKEIYIYVYGPKLGWKVTIAPNITKVYPHGPAIQQQDPSLSPGQQVYTAWPHDGADTVVIRSVEYPNGNVIVDRLRSHYKPWQAIIRVGSSGATPTPSSGKKKGTPTPTPQPSPTPTFNH